MNDRVVLVVSKPAKMKIVAWERISCSVRPATRNTGVSYSRASDYFCSIRNKWCLDPQQVQEGIKAKRHRLTFISLTSLRSHFLIPPVNHRSPMGGETWNMANLQSGIVTEKVSQWFFMKRAAASLARVKVMTLWGKKKLGKMAAMGELQDKNYCWSKNRQK